MNPVISVIIPVYNSEKFLVEAIDSVLYQTLEASEVIIIDDGSSSDKCRRIVESYGARLKYFYKSNGGVASARNMGLNVSVGDYISFLDADDLWMRNKLEKEWQYIELHQGEFPCVYSDITEIDASGNTIEYSKFKTIPWAGAEGWIFENLLHCGYAWTQTLLAKKSIFEDVGYFDESLRASDDRDIALRIAKKYQIGFISEPLVKRRRHNDNVSNRFMDVGLREDCIVIERALASSELKGAAYEEAKRHLGGLYARRGRYALGQGNRIDAARNLIRASLCPGNLRYAVLLPLLVFPGSVLKFLNRLRTNLSADLRDETPHAK